MPLPLAVEARALRVVHPDGTVALAGADLAVAAGEHVAILGPSGAGKSSLLAALAGVVPAQGRRHVAGRVVRIRQDLALCPRRSALANVLAGARGEPGTWGGLRLPAGARERAAALLARVGLAHRAHARVDRLSGGEAQRVAIARALMRRPDVLLADEPVASLDPATARGVMGLLDELRRERGLTLLSVLHDHALARAVADRLVWLEAGRVVGEEPGAAAPDAETRRGLASAVAWRMPARLVVQGPVADAPPGPRRNVAEPRASPLADQAGLPADPAGIGAAPPAEPAETRAGRLPFPAGAPAALRAEPTATAAGLPLAASDAPAAEPTAPAATPAPSPWPARLGWAVAALAIVWAAGVLGPDLARFQGSAGQALAVLGRLWPSPAQLADIDWPQLLRALVETLRMSILGTAGSVLLALPLGAMAARNVAPRWLSAPVRALLNLWRAVPSIIWALLFVAAVGLGVMAGVIALVAYSMGYLTKFFYEAFEGVDRAAPAALAELGVAAPGRFVHAVWPAAAPALAGACLFMLEYNVRAASVLGLVGAGGIGHDLKLAVEWSNWHVAGAILLLLAGTVLVVDALSEWLRARLR